MGSWKNHVRQGLQHRDHREKLPFVQTVSDLTTVLHLKEDEVQYWQSVSQFHQEALTLAKGSNTLKEALSEYEFTIECQSKELAALRVDQQCLKEALADALREKERLLQRWMEEKIKEADRLNNYNITQAWQHLTKHL
uniref:Si:ch1073-143l10.2 n=2 Tax=Haplochromini TaxID=319058 RepID=A0A3Q2VSI4_HAPBU